GRRDGRLALREAAATLAHPVAVGLALPFRIVLHRDLASVLARNAQLTKAVPPPLRSAFARGLGASARRPVTRAAVPADAALRPPAPLGPDAAPLAGHLSLRLGRPRARPRPDRPAPQGGPPAPPLRLRPRPRRVRRPPRHAGVRPGRSRRPPPRPPGPRRRDPRKGRLVRLRPRAGRRRVTAHPPP